MSFHVRGNPPTQGIVAVPGPFSSRQFGLHRRPVRRTHQYRRVHCLHSASKAEKNACFEDMAGPHGSCSRKRIVVAGAVGASTGDVVKPDMLTFLALQRVL